MWQILSKVMKNIIIIIAIMILTLVCLFNIMYTAYISDDIYEIVEIKSNSIQKIGLTMLIIFGLFILCKKLDDLKIDKKVQIILFAILISVYLIGQCWWLNTVEIKPVADQLFVYEAAVDMHNNNGERLKASPYFESYPQQLTLAFMYSIIFKLVGTSPKVLQCLNIIANIFTILGMVFIAKQLSKQYKVNRSKVVILSMTFITLPLLSTFVYGDFISLPMCLFAIYYIMKYSMEGKKKYGFFSAILMAIAYILRMNSLIYILAILIYMGLDLLKQEQKDRKQILEKLLMMLLFIAISIFPSMIMKARLQNKLELNRNRTFPTTAFIYMGMEEAKRGNGWYNEKIALFDRKNIEAVKQEYKEAIVNRMKYFVRNPVYSVDFYIAKTASMWTENTYSAIWYNQTFNSHETKEERLQRKWLDEILIQVREDVIVYQKALVLIIFVGTILTVLKYGEQLSNEALLLIIVFIGGFLFHTLWEAKSRYIISYILVLIPVAAITLDINLISIVSKRIGKKRGKNE